MDDPSEFSLRGPEDFLRLDRRCAELLQQFFSWLQTPPGGSLGPDDAGRFAHAADRYLRDFVVDIQETGPGDADPGLVRQYLGNWYIVNTLTPTHQEMEGIREALVSLYHFLADRRIVPEATAAGAAEALADPTFFRGRLEAFWELTPETITEWRAVDDYRRQRRTS